MESGYKVFVAGKSSGQLKELEFSGYGYFECHFILARSIEEARQFFIEQDGDGCCPKHDEERAKKLVHEVVPPHLPCNLIKEDYTFDCE